MIVFQIEGILSPTSSSGTMNRHRTSYLMMRRRTLAVLCVPLVMSGCAGSRLSTASAPPASLGPTIARPPPTTLPAPTTGGPLRSALALATTKVKTGGTIKGRITVWNGTGRPIEFAGCGGLFAVLLTDRIYHPQPAWPTCVERLTVPTGLSTYPITVDASYQACSQAGVTATVPACGPSAPPGLPPGTYRATTYEATPVVPLAKPVTAVVTP